MPESFGERKEELNEQLETEQHSERAGRTPEKIAEIKRQNDERREKVGGFLEVLDSAIISENLSSEEQKKIFTDEAVIHGLDVREKAVTGDIAQGFLRRLNNHFDEVCHFGVSENELPQVGVLSKMPHPGFMPARDSKHFSFIVLRNIEDAMDATVMSEELAHFYRFRFKPEEEKREELTEEFFGFLGRKLWNENEESKGGALRFLMDNNDWRHWTSRETAVSALKSIKSDQRKLTENEDMGQEKRLKQLAYQRRAVLTHHRGYTFADKVDLEKIHDWPKLFSLPNAEVRKRFFTDKPDYSDL